MKDKLKAIASFNAMEHNGKADINSVISRTMAYFPEERKNLKNLMPLIKEIVDEVNSLSLEQQKNIVEREMPDLLVKKQREEKKLPDLPGIEKSEVVMRIAPSPSGPLHIGHARMSILNDEYHRRYGGKLILRIEDTNPANISPEAYEMIQEDLKWLEVGFTDLIIQSKRIEIYYDVMRRLIEMGHSYVSITPTEEFKKRRQQGVPIKERNDPPEENLERWQKMINGDYQRGEVYAVVKTDLDHPNPAIRDFIAFRIIDELHPLEGDRFKAYPLMNFSVAVDDHLLGLTHVIRGKDHIANTEKQKFIFDYLGWKIPFYLHYGKISIENSVLKTSLIKKGIKSGLYTGWDDPRLGTLLALKKRGFDPESIRKYYVESGIGDVDATFSWEIFYSINRRIIDRKSPRHFFIPDPISLDFDFEGTLIAKIPLFPENDRSFREYEVHKGKITISGFDYNKHLNGEVRLKDLGNFFIRERTIEYIDNSTSRIKEGIQIIHWLSDNSVPFSVRKPDGSLDSGLAEKDVSNYAGIVNQMERYGYVNVLKENEGYFTHP